MNGVLQEKQNTYQCNVAEERRVKAPNGTVYGGQSQGDYWTAADDRKMLSKAVESVKTHSFNLSVATAEGHKTVDMVVSNLGKIGKSLYHLRHGRFDEAARQLSTTPKKTTTKLKTTDVSGRWLELQYGWKPLVSDVYESAQAFQHLTAPPRTSSIRTSVNLPEKVIDTKTVYNVGLPSMYGSGLVSKAVSSRRYIITLQEELSVARSLGLLDPLTVAWELTPYSFVIDWFLPIGSYLEQLSVIPNIKGTWIYNTRFVCRDHYYGLGTNKGAVTDGAFTNFSRSVYTVPPRVVFPGFQPWPKALSAGHVYNAIALAHGLSSR